MSSDHKTRVLVIDDDVALLRLIATLLERADMDAITASDAAAAVQVLRDRPLPDAIVLDMMLPDVNGMEFLRQMRTKSLFDDIPVVILSALSDPDVIREGLSAGADRYLTKPYLAHNLVPTLHDVIRSGRRVAT